jgi:hypothetical protein
MASWRFIIELNPRIHLDNSTGRELFSRLASFETFVYDRQGVHY